MFPQLRRQVSLILGVYPACVADEVFVKHATHGNKPRSGIGLCP